MPIGTRNTSPEQMAANLAAYKAKVAAKIQARKAKATSSAEVDELSGLLSRVSMSSSVDDLDDLMKDLKMGGRRRTRRNKSKGKKRGGDDPLESCEAKVKELEEIISNCGQEMRRLRQQAGRRTRKQKHKGKKHSRKTRKTRRGGVQPPMSLAEKVKMLRAKLADLEKTGNASPAEIAAAEKEWSDAYSQMKRQMGPLERGYRADHGLAG